MKKLIFIFTIIIFAIFEVTILDYFKIFNVKPNILLILVVGLSLSFELRWAIFFSALCGILKDIFSINTFGINTLLFPLWGFLTIELSKKISIDNNFIRIIIIFIIAVLNNIITRLILSYLGKLIPVGIFLRITFSESLYTALILPLIFKIAVVSQMNET